MPSDDAAPSVVAVLADEHRRRMYAFIRRADGPVTRDEAAAAVGVSRKLAAFDLDKLSRPGCCGPATPARRSCAAPGAPRRATRRPMSRCG